MKKLWAPWRMNYIRKWKSQKCIFCVKKKKDKNHFILFRGEKSFIILNIFPYNSGHIMVAPYKHTGKIESLGDKEQKELFFLLKESVRILKKALSPDGFNIGINLGKTAGAGFEKHIHFHIVPRWNGDTNFMPVLGDTKVIPEDIHRTYSFLLPYFSKLKLRKNA